MRLTKIKLAGFKSFVDPVTLYIPSNLVGIVGPNGCGKSNIIDAVRWVIGESSARTLRGESMADVIFTGSSTRKPISQAFVELSFDNSEAKLGGPWACYTEIAIKRLVTRDGQSSYFLNGARCRRRDIIDIFLGTGLGPRSYAIIEQGMISQLIEARPQELRIFLEEAAGISKYKERRRETETRIRHTRENLERLDTLREELAERLQHLQRQARAAEHYQRYRAEERRLRAELLALRWRALDAEVTVQEVPIREQETALEAVIAEQRGIEARLEAGRERQLVLTEAFNQAQQHYYQVGSEMARLEQSLAHQRELHQRQRNELEQAEQALEQIVAQRHADETRLAELAALLEGAEPALDAAHAIAAETAEQVAQAEAVLQDWQAAWEAFSLRLGESQRAADVERTRIEHLERQRLQQAQRTERLGLELDRLAETELRKEGEELHRREQQTQAALVLGQERRVQVEARIGELRSIHQRLTATLAETRERVQAARGRLASLEVLQEVALGRCEGAVGDWLKGQQLESAPRLGEQLSVESGWEQAVEVVLDIRLGAICVEDLDGPAAALAKLEQGSLILVDTTVGISAVPAAPDDWLVNKVRAPWPLQGLLAGVRVVAGLEQALARREGLADQESLITPDGTWLGRNWLRIARDADVKTGVLARERDIQVLNAALAQDTEVLERDTAALERLQVELGELERRHAALQEEVNQAHHYHARLQAQLTALRAQLEQYRRRRSAIAEEQEELRRHAEQDEAALAKARRRLDEALLAVERLALERERLTAQRKGLETNLQEQRARAEVARHSIQQQALTVESLRTSRTSTQQALERLGIQQRQLEERRGQLARELLTADEPLETGQRQLEKLLEMRIQAEEELSQARTAVEGQSASLHALEKGRVGGERRAQELRQGLEARRLALGEARVRRQTLVDQLTELGMVPAAILAEMPATASETHWQVRLERLEKRIRRLGVVNLAAIEECAQLAERKHYLDAQNDDLLEALATLDNAIRQIDRETRSRFKDTFERVSAGLQGLFPRLFGGGQAYLELISEDVLDAGVTIMAQPPGKRIGNIHLLSGGEKALAAVALVFAIFQLNPAPFCMLDEVDAPLDEANVERFGELVREMSERVQFIVITHNKGTMAIVRQLTGVTMHEPGVSRLVSVDIEEAVRLAVL